MKSAPQYATHRQAGFSLIEILVGLAIGLLATLVIMQVFSVFEGQKRTTTGSADAQSNGSIALYSIEQELKMAGYGLLPTLAASPLGCSTLNAGSTGITSISPVTITDGGTAAGASDSITIRYGNSASGGVPSQIKGVGVPGPNDVTLANNLGCQVGDVAMIVNGATCNLTNVIPTATPDAVTVTLQDPAVLPPSPTNFNLACLGTWNSITFQVNPSYDPSVAANSQAYLVRNGAASVADIVNIQAQYGISTVASSNQVTQWVDASGATWAAPTVADRNRIKAVHIAVVARNGLYEKDTVTNTCTTAKGTVNNGPCAWDDSLAAINAAPKIDLSNDPNWRHYRYRVFDTIVPLRNMIWARDTL